MNHTLALKVFIRKQYLLLSLAFHQPKRVVTYKLSKHFVCLLFLLLEVFAIFFIYWQYISSSKCKKSDITIGYQQLFIDKINKPT